MAVWGNRVRGVAVRRRSATVALLMSALSGIGCAEPAGPSTVVADRRLVVDAGPAKVSSSELLLVRFYSASDTELAYSPCVEVERRAFVGRWTRVTDDLGIQCVDRFSTVPARGSAALSLRVPDALAPGTYRLVFEARENQRLLSRLDRTSNAFAVVAR